MSVPKILITIAVIVALINLIGWLTKPDDYRPAQNYRGSLSPMQPYAQQINDQEILALAANRSKS
ncbi:conserved hypothetical protein [Nitrosococcus halophilus Nc 4]|uniref:Uncharacterized protein n=1 Tax=Nitrosococcus halophilus (strain Nc4) TaxID=472759 RepID=D5BW87_NITHN|nr:hypothetical protein [Nitrosococcus halophilus]ADE13737.1 conserved hypothetical protein [Nitrosococcus halophilus Nc 4]